MILNKKKKTVKVYFKYILENKHLYFNLSTCFGWTRCCCKNILEWFCRNLKAADSHVYTYGKKEGNKNELLLIVVLKNTMNLCYVMNLYYAMYLYVWHISNLTNELMWQWVLNHEGQMVVQSMSNHCNCLSNIFLVKNSCNLWMEGKCMKCTSRCKMASSHFQFSEKADLWIYRMDKINK